MRKQIFTENEVPVKVKITWFVYGVLAGWFIIAWLVVYGVPHF